jgi:hypothetical protein
MKIKNKDLVFVKNLLLTCPETGEMLKIVNVAGKKHCCEIIVKGKLCSWKHKIFTEEI